MMATLPYSFLSLIFILIGHRATHSHPINCDSMTCESPKLPIHFPFWLNESNQSNYRCGYPGFELKCSNKNQTLLNLPESGYFIVKQILNQDRKIWVNVDPDDDGCLPRRIMLNGGLSFAGSPFQLGSDFTLANYSFYNCPYDPTSPYDKAEYYIGCLSPTRNMNYSVLAVLSDYLYLMQSMNSSCHLISSAMVPVPVYRPDEVYWISTSVDIQLQWNNLPDQSQGRSKKAEYGLTIGLGIPGFVGMIGLAVLFDRWRKTHDERHQHSTETELSATMVNNTHLPLVVMGLDGESIERYPKTQIGDSGRLPKPSDTTCSICLCDYQPNEVLRTIPECNHYFHADCIDGWLMMNATCPLCRNLPLISSSSSSSLPFSPNSSQ